MDDLIAFVTARLDEDEARARKAMAEWDLNWVQYERYDLPDDVYAYTVHHDPARALREVAAKRAIVGSYDGVRKITGDYDVHVVGLASAVYWLAAVWSDHPGYRAEWKPS